MSDSDHLPLSTLVSNEDRSPARLLEGDGLQAADKRGPVVDETVADLLEDTSWSGFSAEEAEVSDCEDDFIPSAGDVFFCRHGLPSFNVKEPVTSLACSTSLRPSSWKHFCD